jgi:hypothetical protein
MVGISFDAGIFFSIAAIYMLTAQISVGFGNLATTRTPKHIASKI